MSSRKLRIQVGKLLKEQGLGRLYKRGTRPWKSLSSYHLRTLLWKLQFKPGDLVHDCDGFNHILMRWMPAPADDGTMSLDQFEKSSSYWSCGCDASPMPAARVEDIRRYWKDFLNDPYVISGGWSNDNYHKELKRRLECDEPITDNQGILLPELLALKLEPPDNKKLA